MFLSDLGCSYDWIRNHIVIFQSLALQRHSLEKPVVLVHG